MISFDYEEGLVLPSYSLEVTYTFLYIQELLTEITAADWSDKRCNFSNTASLSLSELWMKNTKEPICALLWSNEYIQFHISQLEYLSEDTLWFFVKCKIHIFVSVPFKHTKQQGPYAVLRESHKKKIFASSGKRKERFLFIIPDWYLSSCKKDQSYNSISSLSSPDSLHLHGTGKETQLFLICLLLR